MSYLTAKNNSRIIYSYALLGALLYIINFAFIRLIGKSYAEWSYLNYLLFGVVAWYALKAAESKRKESFNYLQGLLISSLTGALSFVLFSLFVYFYSYFDSYFDNMVHPLFNTSGMLGRADFPFMIAIEGVVFTILLSMSMVKFFRIFYNRKLQIQ